MDDSDFFPIGDEGALIIVEETQEYGEGEYGEGSYGGGIITTTLSSGETTWTDIENP